MTTATTAAATPTERRPESQASVCAIQGEGNEEEDITTIVQLFRQENFFHHAEEYCFWTERPPGAHIGTLVTDYGSKLFCVHRIARMVYVLENLDYALWTI